MIVPVHSGGKIHPEGGRGRRIRDVKRVEAVEKTVRMPGLLTLTVDRKNFAGPEEAYLAAFRKVSKLMELLGIKVWVRVLEVQTQAGDGWPHWHLMIEAAGTDWKHLITCARRLWRDDWGIGNIDLQVRRRRRGSLTGYMVKYLLKGWLAVPKWMLASDRGVRLIGFSKEANERWRAALGQPRAVAGPRSGKRKRRPTRPLVDRLAASGLYCKVIAEVTDGAGNIVRTHVDTIPASWHSLVVRCGELSVLAGLPDLRVRPRESRPGITLKFVAPCGSAKDAATRLRRAAGDLGLIDYAREEYERQREYWWESWDRMQSLQEAG